MSESSNQALVGTDAIKAFLQQFGSTEDPFTKMIVEELLRCLLEGEKNAKRLD